MYVCPVALYGEFKCQSIAEVIQRTVGHSLLIKKAQVAYSAYSQYQYMQ